MALDRSVGEVESGGDLPVRLALAHEGCDALLRRRQRTGGRCAPADPLQLGPCTFGPQRGSDSIEDFQRPLKRLARLAPALRPSLCGSEGEQRPPLVKRDAHPFMEHESLLVGDESSIEIAILRCEQSAAARAVRERGDATQSLRVALVPLEKFDGLFAPTELGEHHDLIDDESRRSGLDDASARTKSSRPSKCESASSGVPSERARWPRASDAMSQTRFDLAASAPSAVSRAPSTRLSSARIRLSRASACDPRSGWLDCSAASWPSRASSSADPRSPWR